MKRLYPDQPVLGIGAVIIKEGKIVLIKRGNEPSKGKWSIPGGLVELGENLEAAVIRETKEETCLEVQTPRLIDVVENVDLDEHGKISLCHNRLPCSSQSRNNSSCKRRCRAALGTVR
jgi:8-oxo-dGTP diphosphatase